MSLPTEQEVKNDLKKLGRDNCNKCYGRGYVGWTDRQGVRIYIPCGKCKRRAGEEIVTLFEDRNWVFACKAEPEQVKTNRSGIPLDKKESEIVKGL